MATPPYVLNAVDKEVRSGGHEKQTVIGIQLTGTFVATVVFEVSLDATTWFAKSVTPADGSAAVTSATAPGAWISSISGYTYFRTRCSAYTSGTPTVRLEPAVA